MLKRLVLSLIIAGLFIKPSYSQSLSKQRFNLTIYNIGVGALVGGAGGFLNKDPNERALKSILRGMGVGAAGGSLVAFGKSITYQITKSEALEFAWLARLTNAAGSSIIQNAYNNNKWWTKWNLNALGMHLEYDVPNNQFRGRVLFSSFITTLVLAKQAKLNVGRTLATGVFFYEKDGLPKGFGLIGSGIGVANSIAVDTNVEAGSRNEFYSLVAHEIVHTLQFDNLYWANPLFKRLDSNLKNKSRLYSNLGKYIHLDLNGALHYLIYEVQKSQPWGCRLYEREAEVFSNRIVPPCN